MKHLDYSTLAAIVLKRKAETGPRVSGLSRDSGIAVVAQAMHQSLRMRRRARRSALAAIAAATALLVVSSAFLYRHLSSQSRTARGCNAIDPSCAQAARPHPVDIGHISNRRILPGSVLKSGSSETVHVRFDSGTELSLASETTVVYDEGAAVHRFSVSRGSAHFRVAKLTKGERFLLDTLDAEVEVRGTVFTASVVNPTARCGHGTEVTVEEGVVDVRSGNRVHTLRAGEHWPDCAQTAAPVEHREVAKPHASVDRRKPRVRTEANESPAPDVISPPEKGARNQALPTKEAGMERASDLRVQNDLYARAYDEQKLGHTTSALALYEQLISQFPNSALIESAYAQRLRLLKQTSNGNRAKVEAQHYLDRFPAGFARTDARSILSSP